MYKVYNFEANFNQYLKSLNISKKTSRHYLVFFRSFLNWLTLKLKVNSAFSTPKSLLPYLSENSLNKYKKFLSEAKLAKSSTQIRISILTEYAKYLKSQTQEILKNISNPTKVMEESILSEFLQELEEKGAGRSTIRSYRSDIRQFLEFLIHNS